MVPSPSSPISKKQVSLRTIQAGLLLTASVSFAYGFLYDGPPPDDPSAWTDLVVGSDPHVGPEHMNHGTFEGGATGTAADTTVNNVRDGTTGAGGGFNVPTGAPPSPDFGAERYSMQMLRFEEFGLKPMETTYVAGNPLPPPFNSDAGCCPEGQALDDFLSQPIYPEPTCYSNCTDQNPWKAEIEAYLGHTLAEAPCEGRPEGEGWSHQRWDEFPPLDYFVTAQNGARTNTGFRDAYQRHGYSNDGDGSSTGTGFSEFGPGGLYHNTAGVPATEGTTAGIPVKYHPDMPLQGEESLWTWDGTFPPKLLTACYGRSLVMRHYNTLPIDISANRGFGAHTITTHEHNGHNPAESDGYANAFFFPGQFYDYRWPMLLAGNDSINTDASDPRAGCPDGNGGIINVPGDFRETMSTHWFHDHMLDFTAQNVY
ncbi:MAG TPA: copper oxidase, partial [Planctomycetes bacterium]|nr:copper oxidase [Planctomycetota bacterium]